MLLLAVISGITLVILLLLLGIATVRFAGDPDDDYPAT